jgi:hypothetical protein
MSALPAQSKSECESGAIAMKPGWSKWESQPQESQRGCAEDWRQVGKNSRSGKLPP